MLKFVFAILGVLYCVSWGIQALSGSRETPEQRRARLQARSEALRQQMQNQRRPQQSGQRRPSGRQAGTREADVLRTLERTLGLPEGSVAPPAPRAPTPPPAPRPVSFSEPEDHGGDLKQHHLSVHRESMTHLAQSTVGQGSNVGGLAGQQRLQSSFAKEANVHRADAQSFSLAEQLSGLNQLQKAIVLNEILQPPVARRQGRRQS